MSYREFCASLFRATQWVRQENSHWVVLFVHLFQQEYIIIGMCGENPNNVIITGWGEETVTTLEKEVGAKRQSQP
jgi:hypothetical protein